MFITNWNDYCTCQRCPCCGKLTRPFSTINSGKWVSQPNHLTCTMGNSTLSNEDLEKIRQGIQDAAYTIS